MVQVALNDERVVGSHCLLVYGFELAKAWMAAEFLPPASKAQQLSMA
jgi:hypothetical protein